MLPSTMPLAVSTEAFPRSGEAVEERSDETDEGAPTDAANGCSPLIRLLTAFAATCSPSGTSRHLPRSGGVFPPRGEGFSEVTALKPFLSPHFSYFLL